MKKSRMFWVNKSIRRKLLVFICLAALFPLIAISIFYTNYSRHTSIKNNLDTINLLNSESQKRLSALFLQAETKFNDIPKTDGSFLSLGLGMGDAQAMQRYLNALVRANPLFSAYVVCTGNGQILARSSTEDSELEPKLEIWPYSLPEIYDDSAVLPWQDYRLSGQTIGRLGFYAPVLTEQGSGVFIGFINLEQVQTILNEEQAKLKSINMKSGGIVLVKSSDKQVVLSSQVTAVLRKAAIDWSALNRGHPEIPIKGQKWFGISRQITLNSTSFHLISVISEADILRDVYRIFIMSFLVFVCSVLGIVTTIFAISRKLSKPIIDLSHQASRMGEGDYDTEIAIDSEDEIGVLATIFDASRKKIQANMMQLMEKNKQLQKATDAAESANRAKTDFLANVSHELKTPINGIMNTAANIMDGAAGELSEAMTRQMAIITTCTDNLYSQVANILEFSRYESNRETLKIEEIQISKIHEFITRYGLRYRPQEGVILDNQVDITLPPVWGDFEQLKHVFENLLSNAIKFTHKGRITMSAVDQGKFIEFRVSDTGIGISQADIPHVFDRFWQADATASRQYEGTGIGLSIAKSIVESHQSSIWLKSDPGKGTTFYFTLHKEKFEQATLPEMSDRPEVEELSPMTEIVPLISELQQTTGDIPVLEMKDVEIVDNSASQLLANTIISVDTKARADFHSQVKLLIVDDIATNVESLKTFLDLNRFVVEIATSGAEALKKIRSFKPDILICDIMMPEMNGYEVTRIIRNSSEFSGFSDLPIFLLTAKNTQEDKLVGFDSGADEYVGKPYDRSEFLARIRVHARIKKLQDRIKQQRENLELEVQQRTREYLEAKNMAEKASQFKSTFLATMTHDLRTPLHVVIGILDILSKDKRVIDDGLLDTIHVALQSSENQLSLVNNILDLSKIEAGKMDFDFKPFPITQLFIGLDHQVSVLLGNKRVEFEIEHTVENKILVADKLRIQQVLTNLLSNATKFTEYGHIKLKVSEVTYQESPYIQFVVSDTGIGIPDEKLVHVFESYSMFVHGSRTKLNGSGLGLHISKGFVEGHGGHIFVKSEVGLGTEFTFYIPFKASSASYAEIPLENQVDLKYLRSKHIMLVDDDSYNLFLAELILMGKAEYSVHEDACSALESFRAGQYDIILTDLEMPVMNGHEFLKKIREINPGVPVIAMTAAAIKGTQELVLEQGFNGYLLKPFKEKEFLSFIEQALKKHE